MRPGGGGVIVCCGTCLFPGFVSDSFPVDGNLRTCVTQLHKESCLFFLSRFGVLAMTAVM